MNKKAPETKLPILRGVLADGESIKVFCPQCDDYHHHSWSKKNKPTSVTHRVAHCFTRNGIFAHTGYYVGLLSEEQKRIRDEKREG